MLKRVSRVTIGGVFFTIAALMLTTVPPAGAAGAGGGVVTGTVTSSGIDLTPRNTSFTFNPGTVLTGTIAGTDDVTNQPAAYAGPINTSTVSGNGVGETTISGTGTINGGWTFSGTNALGHTINGVAEPGSFTRVGAVVSAHFWVRARICVSVSPPGVTVCINVRVHVWVYAAFVPTSGDGVTTPVTQASFAGVFDVQSVV